jgi:hypothetical protein
MVAPIPAEPSADFQRRHTLGQYLALRLGQLGVEKGTAVAAGLHVATTADLWDAVTAGRSILVFSPSGYFTRLCTRESASEEATRIRAMLGDEAPENAVMAVDIAPMVHVLSGGAELN